METSTGMDGTRRVTLLEMNGTRILVQIHFTPKSSPPYAMPRMPSRCLRGMQNGQEQGIKRGGPRLLIAKRLGRRSEVQGWGGGMEGQRDGGEGESRV